MTSHKHPQCLPPTSRFTASPEHWDSTMGEQTVCYSLYIQCLRNPPARAVTTSIQVARYIFRSQLYSATQAYFSLTGHCDGTSNPCDSFPLAWTWSRVFSCSQYAWICQPGSCARTYGADERLHDEHGATNAGRCWTQWGNGTSSFFGLAACLLIILDSGPAVQNVHSLGLC